MTPRRTAAALGAAFALACGGEAAPPPAPPVRVLLIGDSITAGRVSHPTGPAYASLLGEQLGSRFELVNLGCGGSSALDWTRSRGGTLCGSEYTLPNLYDKRVRPALPADLAIVLLGTNDSRSPGQEVWSSPEDYEAALREIATNLLADGAARVMLLGPPLVVHHVWAMLRIVRYGEAVQRICAEIQGVTCGPDVRLLLGADDFAAHNVHPNASGHRKIADALAQALRALYAEERSESSEAAAASSSPG